jgi:hypothetical protein
VVRRTPVGVMPSAYTPRKREMINRLGTVTGRPALPISSFVDYTVHMRVTRSIDLFPLGGIQNVWGIGVLLGPERYFTDD